MIAAAEGRSLKASFTEESGPGYYLGVDHKFRLQELGWIRFPTLQHLSWAAQWLKYRENLDHLLDKAERNAEIVSVYTDEVRPPPDAPPFFVSSIFLHTSVVQNPKSS